MAFLRLSRTLGHVAHVLLRRSPLGIASSFDLHVLGTPPAFVLSHDQTLRRNLDRAQRNDRWRDCLFRFAFSPTGRGPALHRVSPRRRQGRCRVRLFAVRRSHPRLTRGLDRSFSRTYILYETFKGLPSRSGLSALRLTISIIPQKTRGCQGGRREKEEKKGKRAANA